MYGTSSLLSPRNSSVCNGSTVAPSSSLFRFRRNLQNSKIKMITTQMPATVPPMIPGSFPCALLEESSPKLVPARPPVSGTDEADGTIDSVWSGGRLLPLVTLKLVEDTLLAKDITEETLVLVTAVRAVDDDHPITGRVVKADRSIGLTSRTK